MALKFDDPTQELLDHIEHVIDVRYPELRGVTYKALMIYEVKRGIRTKQQCLKVRGTMAAASIRIMSVEDRRAGSTDLRLIVDLAVWDTLKPGQREALLAHEFYHPKRCKDSTGKPQLDEAERPKLYNERHDLELGVFKQVIDWYGNDAIDTLMCRRAAQLVEQIPLPLMDLAPPEPPEPPQAPSPVVPDELAAARANKRKGRGEGRPRA